MKKSIKKLTLHRETLGGLSEGRLALAAGASGATCWATCNTMCFVCPPITRGGDCSQYATFCNC